MTKIILASSSPRRRDILNNIGIAFEVINSSFNEDGHVIDNPIEYCKFLAYNKAKTVAQGIESPSLVIGADTIVVFNDIVLGKPKNYNDAYEMISLISGNTHQVMTGVSVIETPSMRTLTDHSITDVKIKSLSEENIHNYLSKNESFDKAGAYGIQGYGSLLVEKIDGCYFNVVGLPVFKVSEMLQMFGYNVL